MPRSTLYMAAALIIVNSACNQNSNQAPAQKGSTDSGTNGATGTLAGSNSGTGPGSTSGVDAILVNALGDENPELAQPHTAFLQSLLGALGSTLSGRNGRLALIASPNAAVSGVSATAQSATGLAAENVTQIPFELAPRDALLGPLVAGCDPATSNLDSSHAAGSVTICGQAVPIPPHAWTWGVEDIKGRLTTFLRPGMRRVYIVVASSDAMTAANPAFASIAAQQNAGNAPTLIAIVPDGGPGVCNPRNAVATNITATAQGSPQGAVLSYCQADWSPYIATIVGSL